MLLNASHFENQLLPNEEILWFGQPQKEAFVQEARRLEHFIICFVLLWSLIYGVKTIWQHSLLYSYSHGGIAIVTSGLVLAALCKVVFTFTQSSAGKYWYAVTNERVFAEIPDDGGQTTMIAKLSDVKQISLKRGKAHSMHGDIGTITITTSIYRERKVYFRCICDVTRVSDLLKEIT